MDLIDISALSSPKLVSTNPELQGSQYQPLALSADGVWITYNSENLLRLPLVRISIVLFSGVRKRGWYWVWKRKCVNTRSSVQHALDAREHSQQLIFYPIFLIILVSAGAFADRENRVQRLPLQPRVPGVTGPRCECGKRRQTVAYILLRCRNYKDLRNWVFGNLPG